MSGSAFFVVARTFAIAGPACAVFLSAASVGQELASDEHCLFGGEGSEATVDCGTDRRGLASNAELKRAMQAFEIDAAEIDLVGCRQTRFKMRPFGAQGEEARFSILYPVGASEGADAYVAPLTHELAHIFQVKLTGSLAALRHSLGGSTERIELGADFLSGMVYKRHLADTDRGTFQRNMRLLGSYRSGTYHGRPEDRVAAFRMGYYSTKSFRDLAAAHADFQSNGYPTIQSFRR